MKFISLKNTLILIILTIILILISACVQPTAPAGETPGPDPYYTAAAETVIAQFTAQAGQTAVAELTRIAGRSPTQTPTVPPPTQTATQTPTSTPTQTLLPLITPTFTPTSPPATPIICNVAEFIRDVTFPDGSEIPPSAYFKKIWQIRNIGNCFWDSSYTLSFTSGVVMSNELDIPIPSIVSPGGTIDLAVDMYAPQQTGRFTNQWVLRDRFGQIFGVGPNGRTPFGVDIQVRIPNGIDTRTHLGIRYCDAAWSTGFGTIGCTQPLSDPMGFVVLLTDPQLESRDENELALWMRPNQSPNGYISGRYPAYTVSPGEYFVAEIGCLRGQLNCDVTFELDYISPDGTTNNLGSWRQRYDQQSEIIVVDLAPLAGQTVQFILRVENRGVPGEADAIWFMPQFVLVNELPPAYR